jgi:hypothetical protein
MNDYKNCFYIQFDVHSHKFFCSLYNEQKDCLSHKELCTRYTPSACKNIDDTKQLLETVNK